MNKYQNTGQLATQIDELKKEVNELKKGAIFYCPVRRFLCGAAISLVAATVLLVVSFSLCSGGYCQRRVKTEILVILTISEHLISMKYN